jgi:hypothetical protein
VTTKQNFKQKILTILGILILLVLLAYLGQNLLSSPADNASIRAPIGTVIY